MNKKRIYQIWNGDIKVTETTSKMEIAFAKSEGYKVIKTDSFVKSRYSEKVYCKTK